MGRSWAGRRARGGRPSLSAAERRAELAEADDIAEARAVAYARDPLAALYPPDADVDDDLELEVGDTGP